MSNIETDPDEIVCRSEGLPGPEAECRGGATVELIGARDVPLGGPRAMTVRRTLPQRQRSLIGPWCFVDHYGPDDVAHTGGMDVAPHPHTGLQTVSWLFEGAIEHIDSGGNTGTVLPAEMNLMTAGAGICHSEVSPMHTQRLHGVQLWLALPDAVRHQTERRFEHYAPEPVEFPGGSALVFLGSLFGRRSPVAVHSPLVGAEIRLDPGQHIDINVDSAFEHGLLVDTGSIRLDGVAVAPHSIGYTGTGTQSLRIANDGPASARAILLGGVQFGEEIIMWWNFVGRDHNEILQFRDQWENGGEMFGRVEGYVGRGGPGKNASGLSRLPAPPMPAARLKPRRNPPPESQNG